MRRYFAAVCLTVATTTLSAALAANLPPDSAGDKALHDYVLTMPKVRAYEVATAAAKAATKADASLRTEEAKADNEPDKTLADIKAKLARHPRLFAFFAKQGLSMDDAVLVPLTLMNACTVAQYPQIAAKMADTVSAGQIAFCKQNMSELKKMAFFGGSAE